MSVQKLYRRDNQPFSQVPNYAIRNPAISNTGFRLLVYLMSHKDGYELSYRQIKAETGMGRHAIQNATKNLEELGWLTTELTKLPNGKFGAKAWILNDVTSAPNSTAADSTAENGALFKNTNSNNTTLEKNSSSDSEESDSELFDDAVYARCNKLAEMVKANGHNVGTIGKLWWRAADRLTRIDGYTDQEINEVMEWALKDEFWGANIRSMSKFREKFTTLRARMRNAPKYVEPQRNLYDPVKGEKPAWKAVIEDPWLA